MSAERLLADVDISALEYTDADRAVAARGYVFDHLVRSESHNERLPNPGIDVTDGHARVVRGVLWVAVAEALGRDTVTVEVVAGAETQAAKRFLESAAVANVRTDKVGQRFRDRPLVRQLWFTLFFGRPLTSADRSEFERQVLGFFEELKRNRRVLQETGLPAVCDLVYSYGHSCVEFRGLWPVGDEQIPGGFLGVCESFSSTTAPIVSINGRWFAESTSARVR